MNIERSVARSRSAALTSPSRRLATMTTPTNSSDHRVRFATTVTEPTPSSRWNSSGRKPHRA